MGSPPACVLLPLALAAASSAAAAQTLHSRHGPAPSPAAFTRDDWQRGVRYRMDHPSASGTFGCGLALVDLDEDGDADAVLLGGAGGQAGLFENDGGGWFTDRSEGSGIPPLYRPSGVCAADYDSDGDLDLYLSNWLLPNLLLRNDGGFHFTDVTAASGLGDPGAGTGCAWGDVDGDGRPDLFLANRTGTDEDTHPNRIFRNLGGGAFQDVTAAWGLGGNDALTFQGVFFDPDRDGDLDLYLSNDKGYLPEWRNQLWRNDGGVFSDATDLTSTGIAIDSMGVAVGDFHRNGWPDLYLTNTPLGNELLLNRRFAFFGASLPAGVGSFLVGWGALFFDFDHDSFQDLFVCNMTGPDRLYWHGGSWPAYDLAPAAGLDSAGMGFSAAVADVDLDGDLDLLVGELGTRVGLYLNHEGERRSWMRLRVVGKGLNTHAIGARVDVLAGGAWQFRSVSAGGGYKSQSEGTLHFGLDHAARADAVAVVWPDGTRRSLTDYPAGFTFELIPPDALGDADGDGRLGPADLLHLYAAWTGPGPARIRPGGEVVDMDGDGDVDGDDLRLWTLRARSRRPRF